MCCIPAAEKGCERCDADCADNLPLPRLQPCPPSPLQNDCIPNAVGPSSCAPASCRGQAPPTQNSYIPVQLLTCQLS